MADILLKIGDLAPVGKNLKNSPPPFGGEKNEKLSGWYEDDSVWYGLADTCQMASREIFIQASL